jgi:hypothetical protein
LPEVLVRTHNDQTTDGKLFCAFIDIIALSFIQDKLGATLRKKSLSKKGALAELDKLKVVEAGAGRRLVNPATKTQRDMLEALGLTEDELRAWVARQPR